MTKNLNFIIGTIIFFVLLISGLIVYIIHTERTIKELTQENLILQTNMEQARIEQENNNKIIKSLTKQIHTIRESEIKKQYLIKQQLNDDNIKNKSKTNKQQDISIIFNDL